MITSEASTMSLSQQHNSIPDTENSRGFHQLTIEN